MRSKNVFLRVEGGLGNQLFQYAAGRSLADRLECGLALDLRGIRENGDRAFQLGLYHVRAVIADDDMLDTLPSWRNSRIARIRNSVANLLPYTFGIPVFSTQNFGYDGRIERLRNPVYMVGYWQTERYFQWNRKRLLQDLNLQLKLSPDLSWLKKVRNSNSVALHVRRGDYVSNPNKEKHLGTCDLNYYNHAVTALMRKHQDIELFVFSDDPPWVANNLTLPLSAHIVDAHPPEFGYLDIELIRNCKHHIVANSSFSWWGAW